MSEAPGEPSWIATHTRYGVRYTDATAESRIAYDPDEYDPYNRAFAATRCRGIRSEQEDRGIPVDATLMRRLPGGEWEEDTEWAADIQAWDEYVAKMNALDAADDVQSMTDLRYGRDRWLANRRKELLAAGGEAR
ncbi:hypothetical protein [Nonomuraea wenchangensis]|uniref:Uncharacterized protein n=1 Tax=Nonomuraea wenchangensis TaxID=568860 RepID=A0A1I0LW91_9ACTN|nr:hypothetical protein [Nonomuraea wenchangensis]SEU46513.1 hypothetical protein SAMN05421811_12761 [Nonomuraea wenchangensis]